MNNPILKLWEIISASITCYLIQQSYTQLKNNQRTTIFENPIDEEEFISLRSLGSGSSFRVELIYHIEKSELFAIKIPNGNNDTQKLIDREIENYQNFMELVKKKNLLLFNI